MTLPVVILRGRAIPVRSATDLGTKAVGETGALVRDPEALDRRCRAALLEIVNIVPGGATYEYVRHHLELLGSPPQGAVDVPAMITHEAVGAFVGAMYVRAIWVWPDSDRAFASLDYTIDEHGTDYVLSVRLDRDGHIRSVAMES